ncbi:hypothetical protein [Mesorhizobium sp. NBSH29]|uniref:hypothetical protein n=1 Tax=Mesorhizobium sp. NBSH29 TaxID=2654249 RepID=UPI0018965D1A|nr:hypothetical protein [Mesorhizobium sp. NBSH29]
MTQYRIGDRVTVEGTIVNIGAISRYLDVSIGDDQVSIQPTEPSLKLVERPFAVGDKVMWGNALIKILAIHKDVAWVLYPNRTRGVADLSDLTRIPDEGSAS